MVPGYEIEHEATGAPLVLELFESIYGLLVQPLELAWNHDTFLVRIGFKAPESDPYVYIFNGMTTAGICYRRRPNGHPQKLCR